MNDSDRFLIMQNALIVLLRDVEAVQLSVDHPELEPTILQASNAIRKCSTLRFIPSYIRDT